MATYAVPGKKATILVDNLDASEFLNEYEFESERDDIDVTVFGKEDKDFLSGSAENTVTLTGLWNGDETSLDELLDDTFGGDVDNIITICPGGVTSGKACYLASATQVAYTVSAEADDLTEAEAEFRSARVRGSILKTPVPVTATGNGSAVVRAKGATSKGAVAHLHLFGLTGAPTSVVIDVEGSADGTTWAVVPGLSYTVTASSAAEKKATLKTATIPAQLRAKHTITGGTTPSLNYVLAVGRNR